MYKIINYQEKYKKGVTDLVISVFIKEFGFEHYREAYESIDIMKYIKDGGKCWIAIENNEVIGTILLINSEDNIAELKMMYVKNEYRGQGVSQKLFDIFLQYATENNYEKIILGTYDRLARAIQFYKKLGFVEYYKEKYTLDDRYFYLDLINEKEKYA